VFTSDGKTAYVPDAGAGTVTPIRTATNTAGPPIAVGTGPFAIAITPDGTTAYVTNDGSGTVTRSRPLPAPPGRPSRSGVIPLPSP
jgi:YVTN family beta-propeller protein